MERLEHIEKNNDGSCKVRDVERGVHGKQDLGCVGSNDVVSSLHERAYRLEEDLAASKDHLTDSIHMPTANIDLDDSESAQCLISDRMARQWPEKVKGLMTTTAAAIDGEGRCESGRRDFVASG